MKIIKYIFMAIAALALAGCEDFLDRPQKTDLDDNNYWASEGNVRLFVNGNYANYFVGYNSSWGTAFTVLRGYNFCDDFVSANKQRNFSVAVPADNWFRKESVSWVSEYAGSGWNFAWVRKHNILINRLEGMKENKKLTEEEYNHWMGVARFFRGLEYSRLVESFGDVPYYDAPVGEKDYDAQFKNRDSRVTVMDAVYDDFKFALDNIRENDGVNYLNKFVAAGFISRCMLFEGTWYKYHKIGDAEHAKKFLQMAVDAGDLVIKKGNYKFDADFRSLFGSTTPAGMNEIMMYRYYSDDPKVRHCIASYSNLTESQGASANLALAKSFICNDGKTYQQSGVANAKKFDHKNLAKTRDPRFEATFWDEPDAAAGSLLYACKFIDREGVTYYSKKNYPPQYKSQTNTNGYPVMRYAEVVLNWIEAKAELALSYGGPAVTQDDLDASINAIRKRPLDEVAKAKGVKQTANLTLPVASDFDPERDDDVDPLIWEIRRERRMEFVFEHTRLADIRRWHKLDYMDGDKNPDLLRGIWVDFNNTQDGKITTFFDFLIEKKIGSLKVMKEDGTILTYDGTNAADMVGYYIPANVQNRDKFDDKVYLAPVCTDVLNMYKDKGYEISQNPGW